MWNIEMMKKIIITACLASMTLVAFGCGSVNVSTKGTISSSPQTIDDILAQNSEMNANDLKEMSSGESDELSLQKTSYNCIDYDLTSMSSTLIYAQVSNMINDPESYMGKVIKMSGLNSIYEDPDTKKKYFSCIVPDATACCAQGIEFDLKDDALGNLLNEGQEITVVGVFGTYLEKDALYLTLKDAELTVN